MKIAAGLAGVSYGVLSAYADRTDSQNEFLHQKLQKELEGLGYSPVESIGEWEGVPEKCWVVPNINISEFVELARRYEQEAVIVCARGGRPRILKVGGVPKPPVSRPMSE